MGLKRGLLIKMWISLAIEKQNRKECHYSITGLTNPSFVTVRHKSHNLRFFRVKPPPSLYNSPYLGLYYKLMLSSVCLCDCFARFKFIDIILVAVDPQCTDHWGFVRELLLSNEDLVQIPRKSWPPYCSRGCPLLFRKSTQLFMLSRNSRTFFRHILCLMVERLVVEVWENAWNR